MEIDCTVTLCKRVRDDGNLFLTCLCLVGFFFFKFHYLLFSSVSPPSPRHSISHTLWLAEDTIFFFARAFVAPSAADNETWGMSVEERKGQWRRPTVTLWRSARADGVIVDVKRDETQMKDISVCFPSTLYFTT